MDSGIPTSYSLAICALIELDRGDAAGVLSADLVDLAQVDIADSPDVQVTAHDLDLRCSEVPDPGLFQLEIFEVATFQTDVSDAGNS